MSIQSTQQVTKETAMKQSKLARAKKLMKGTRGASIVEYALLLAVMIVVGGAIFRTLGQSVNTKATEANTKLNE
ncbi:MAG: hypothetical protein KBF88_14055 [Polyangiaceae bacterium]|nr:hypothetical protein [Polyangiaceae bacterium]